MHGRKLSAVLNVTTLRVWGLTALIAVGVFSLTRFILLAHSVGFSDQPLAGLLGALWRGLARDGLVAAMLAAPFALHEMLLPQKWRDFSRWPLLVLYIFALLFVAVSEIVFWDEFSARFNFIAVDYLVFTTELIGNIREAYPVGKIMAALMVFTLLLALGLRRSLFRAANGKRLATSRQWLFVLPLLLILCTSTYKLNPPEFSNNNFANELADNGWRSFLWAARQNKLDYRQFYAVRPNAEVMKDLHRLSGHSTHSVTADPLLKVSLPLHRQPNVVVVMMESMSAEYLAAFGNEEGLTPNLDRLAAEGMFFTRLYATGSRGTRHCIQAGDTTLAKQISTADQSIQHDRQDMEAL